MSYLIAGFHIYYLVGLSEERGLSGITPQFVLPGMIPTVIGKRTFPRETFLAHALLQMSVSV